jgi:hypothetical protein
MDSDTELVFYSNGDACMLEWGISGEGFAGNFHLHEDGCVVSWFKDSRSEWPVMVVEQQGPWLLLRPLNPPNGLTPLEPGASTRPAEKRYWQFRMLMGDDEQQVFQTIKKWGVKRRPQ